MLFNSYVFILFFLPVTLVSYYLAEKAGKDRLAKAILTGMSLWFYAYFHVAYLAVILCSIGMNYAVARICMKTAAPSRRKLVTAVGIAGNIGIILYYKYLDFLIENVNALCSTDVPLRHILMPLGISFFTFQQISYLADTYAGETKKDTLLDYMLFVTFFPQLVAGPIVTYGEMLPQFRNNRSFSWGDFSEGLYKFAVGLGKKVLLADVLGRFVDEGYSVGGGLTTVETALVALCYTFQLYLDFSGYCDMASGAAQMFGIRLPVNFNSPYKALSISEFWDRWHMSLTNFFRKYLYFPLGGSRKGTARTYLNILILFLVSGIWHGAAWTFILWGVYNGIWMVLYRAGHTWWDRLPKAVRWMIHFPIVNIGWMLFRADSLKQFADMVSALFCWKSGGVRTELAECFHVLEYTYVTEHVPVLARLSQEAQWLPMALFLLAASGMIFFARNLYETKFVPDCRRLLLTIFLLVWSVLSLTGVTTFLYFNF